MATVASLAAPPAHGRTGWRRQKVVQVEAYARWFESRRTPRVVGVDANTPKREAFALDKTEWWWPEERAVWGDQRRHDLRDVYRERVESDPTRSEDVRGERPDGPLAVWFLRRGTPCRYDVVHASTEFSVVAAGYGNGTVFQRLSDHFLGVGAPATGDLRRRRVIPDPDEDLRRLAKAGREWFAQRFLACLLLAR